MKRIMLVFAGALALAAGEAGADSISPDGLSDRVLPVLVNVDAHGRVTHVSSAVELTPRFNRLLRQTLDQWITGPAMDQGKAMPSQFVMKVGMQAKARSDGTYDTSFVYLSSSPAPAGEWVWQHENDQPLALVRADNLNYRDSSHRHHMAGFWQQPGYYLNQLQPMPVPGPTPTQAPLLSSHGR